MGDLSAPEAIGMGLVAVMAIKMASDVVKSVRHRNGHGKPDPVSVSKENAPEFWLMQSETNAIVKRVESMLRDVHGEMLDDQVARHHRQIAED